MRKQLSFILSCVALLRVLGACNSNETSSSINQPVSRATGRTSKGPTKGVSDLSISLGNESGKAYITVRGTQNNYTAEEFKWAWGLKEQDSSLFVDGKANPTAEDFQTVTFNSSNEFTVKYCLSDITAMKAGTLYRIYGGTPESYSDIQFASNMFGANDGERKYYLRQDQDNSLVYESIQPLTYTLASIVEIAEADLPNGITNAGAYLKFGGVNSKNLTEATLDAWNQEGKIAGDFQRVIPANSYSIHTHVDAERFWKVEGNNIFFYLYVGFIDEEEGWMVHFDLVSGNQGSGLQTETKFNGETAYTINEATYKIYSDTSKSGEENYWGCLGVYREKAAA